MSQDAEGCVLRGDSRRLIPGVVALLALGLVAVFVARSQGFVTVFDVLAGAGLAALVLWAAAGAFFNRRYRVTLSAQGLTVDHPWEKFSVDWDNLVDVTPLFYGIMRVQVRDEARVHIRNSAVIRRVKELSGQPYLTFSTRQLKGGESRFLDCFQAARAKWGHPAERTP